jgi:hypothetical protein
MPETRTGEPSTLGTSTITAPRGVAQVHWTVPTLGALLPQPETTEARTTKENKDFILKLLTAQKIVRRAL